ncbi:MAG TPA: methyl-accepting chemotaxis protein, partial [Chloroflexia bacterium]|nr:methyl-accepting chemotaxis protein [Chloroflexia bacterium]
RSKLITGFLTIALFLLILTILSIIVIDDLGNKSEQVAFDQQKVTEATLLNYNTDQYKQTLDKIFATLNNIEVPMADVNKGVISLDAGLEQVRPFLRDYDRYKTDFMKARNNILDSDRALFSGQSGLLSAGPFYTLVEDTSLTNQFQQMAASVNNRQPDKTVAVWNELSKTLVSSIDTVYRFNQDLDNFVSQTKADSANSIKNAQNARNFWKGLLLAAGLVALVLAITFGAVLTNVFIRPVEQLRKRLVKLAEGDLKTGLEVPNRDQFGELAATFNQSITRLGGLVEQVQEQAVHVSSAASQIAGASNQSASSTIEQASAVAQATATIEELSRTAEQIAASSSLVAEAAQQALGSASDGQKTVKESIAGINSLKDQVQNITERILALSERSQRVGHIIEQVSSIADQTHLLALNAAIESAGAGEYGIRFAVVAANVKQLAERSRQATRDVQVVLEEIQAGTNASVMATEQGLKEAERGVRLAQRAGEANDNIIQIVERTTELAYSISLATQQQRSASEQVVTTMRQLAGVIQEGAASARQSSSLATSLDQVAGELRQMSSQFRVKSAIDITSFATISRNGHSADGGSPVKELVELPKVYLN